MSTTKHRTSFALDEHTADRLQRLSRRWKVSQAEVVRRAVALAADRAETDSVLERLEAYHAKGAVEAEAADSYLREAAEDRSRWERDW